MMRMIILTVLSAMTIVPAAAAQEARGTQPTTISNYYDGGNSRISPDVIIRWYVSDLNKLRQKALVLQGQEGGALTEVSRAGLQTELDKLQARYERRLRNNHDYYVNAAGTRVAPQLPRVQTID